MSKFTENYRSFRKQYWITAIIAFVLGSLGFILYFFLQERSWTDAVNGSTISFVCLLGIGGLMWVGENGAFDSVAYGFKQLVGATFTKKPNKYNDYASYLDDQRTKRSHSPHLCLSFVFISFIFGIALVILEILIHTNF